jgi:hypothetical protein
MRRQRPRAAPAPSKDLAPAVRAFIEPHAPPAEASDVDVPRYAWAHFFLCTLERLQHVDAYAAEETIREFLAFLCGWRARYHTREVAAQGEWMARNFTAMKTRSLKRRGRHTSLSTSPRHVLFLQNQIAKGLIPTTPDAIRRDAEAAQEGAREMKRRTKRLGVTFDVEAILRDIETTRQQNIVLAASLPRRKLSYRRHLPAIPRLAEPPGSSTPRRAPAEVASSPVR